MNEDLEPPRLQDTTERAALPLPLPDGGEERSEAEPAPDSQPDVDPLFAPPAAETFGVGSPETGPPPEVLVGAAFLGGVALAFLIKRLGS